MSRCELEILGIAVDLVGFGGSLFDWGGGGIMYVVVR